MILENEVKKEILLKTLVSHEIYLLIEFFKICTLTEIRHKEH